MWHSAARLPDNGALQPDAPAALDDETIDGLLTEVRQVIGSAKFGSALKVSVKHSAFRHSCQHGCDLAPCCISASSVTESGQVDTS